MTDQARVQTKAIFMNEGVLLASFKGIWVIVSGSFPVSRPVHRHYPTAGDGLLTGKKNVSKTDTSPRPTAAFH